MKKTLIIGLLVIALLISGCVSTTTNPSPTMTATPAATIMETAQPTMTATPAATILETTQPTMTSTPATTTQSRNITIVNIEYYSLVPATIIVPPGTTVTWINEDTIQHTVTSTTKIFDSGNIDPGATYTYTFNQTGTFNYECLNHPVMEGIVIVQ